MVLKLSLALFERKLGRLGNASPLAVWRCARLLCFNHRIFGQNYDAGIGYVE